MIGNSLLFMISFVVVLSVLVFIHELGHYGVARIFGTKIETFSIGFGRPLAMWRSSAGVDWKIGAIPLGGYVKFAGDAGAASNPDVESLAAMEADPDRDRYMHYKPLWQRALIVLAGPVANFVLAIVIFAAIALTLGTVSFRASVADVIAGSAAEDAGVRPGDVFLTLDGRDVSNATDIIAYVAIRSGERIEAVLERGGEPVTLDITPRRQIRKDMIGGDAQMGTLGVQLTGEPEYTQHTPLSAIGYGTSQIGKTIAATGNYIGRIFTGREDGKALGGVLRIAAMTGKTAVDAKTADVSTSQKIRNVFWSLANLAAYISIGLGVANLMPIPALDGGHLLFYGYEAAMGRPMSAKAQDMGFRMGFAILLTLFVVLTINDIGYIRSLFT